jgi:hypothetical protein
MRLTRVNLKWFIVELTEKYAGALKQLGVFKEKQLSRMADAALFSDLIYTLTTGIKSASDVNLDRYYTDHEASFPESTEMLTRMDDAMNAIMGWRDIHESSLMKSYNFYTLVLAVTHAQQPSLALNADFPRATRLNIDRAFALPNLTMLSSALDEPARYPTLGAYVAACSKATNRIEQRRARFHWLSTALEPVVVLLIIWHLFVRIIWHSIVPSLPSLIPRSV